MRPAERPQRSGFSLIEMVAASSLFMIVGYVFVVSVDMGSKSRELVMSSSEENRSVRSASTNLVQEIQISTEDEITVTTLPDGNSEVTLRVPIEVGGELQWGTEADELAYDPQAGIDHNPDWSYRYTVEAVGAEKQLVRQILNDQLVVQEEEVLVEHLDTDDEPCFQVVKTGAMWIVEIAARGKSNVVSGHESRTKGRRSEFHVRTRN